MLPLVTNFDTLNCAKCYVFSLKSLHIVKEGDCSSVLLHKRFDDRNSVEWGPRAHESALECCMCMAWLLSRCQPSQERILGPAWYFQATLELRSPNVVVVGRR